MMRKIVFRFVLLPALGAAAIAQNQPAAPKPQTPRQALIEIVTKGGDSVLKHLTVEVQELLLKNKSSGTFLTALASMKSDSGLQSFEAGDILFSYSEPRERLKYELQVDNDDLAGTEDTLMLSLHMFRDGKEEDDSLGLMSPHFTINLKQQQNIWRLDKLSIGADFPIGDPDFIQKMFLRKSEGVSGSVALVPGWHATSPSTATQPATMPPQQVVSMLAISETLFARQHPETGFTCSLAELAETAKLMGLDNQVSSGSYNGYRFAIAGCEGKPAASFQITAEPIAAGQGAKAYCTDATQNVRVLEGGSGANCLTLGKVQTSDGATTLYSPLSTTTVKMDFEPH